MPKKRRIYLGMPRNKKNPQTPNTPTRTSDSELQKDEEMMSARGRLKGALMDVLEPAEEDTDTSESSPIKRERDSSDENNERSDDKKKSKLDRTSYVLKLYDRSVDLSQFNDDTPLYPICRAWMLNMPKAVYKDLSVLNITINESHESITLPGPEGPILSRIPDLLPEQKACNKDNIKLEYDESPLPTQKELMEGHLSRWVGIRQAWMKKAVEVEARYQATQDILNEITAGT